MQFRLKLITLTILALYVLIEWLLLLNLKSSPIEENLKDLKQFMVVSFHNRLTNHEFKKYSQNFEDGILSELIIFLNLFNSSSRYFVEIGTQSGIECNTRYLREYFLWYGIMFDNTYSRMDLNLHQEVITHDNVLEIFEKYRVRKEIDLLSEDTDYADYWILESILTRYRPKIVVHEVNQQPPDKCVTVPKPDKVIFWDRSEFHGASVCAFYCLAKRFNYTMIYCESQGVNCFWVRNDLLEEHLHIEIEFIQSILNPQFLFRKAKFTYRSTDNEWFYITC